MSRRRTSSHDNAPGSDSFLDIVANMVGIMIILVMVVGVQAKDAFLNPPDPAVAEAKTEEQAAAALAAEQRQAELQTKQRAVAVLKSEVDDLAEATAHTTGATKSQLQERNHLQQLAVAAERLIQQERAKLNEEQQADFDFRRQLAAAHDELEDLTAAQLAVENTAATVVHQGT